MKPALAAKLVADFPELLADFDGDWRCRSGWEPIIRRLFAKLPRHDVRVMTVKEKFGELRVYVIGDPLMDMATSDEVSLLIDEATEESRHTCELCGGPAALRTWEGPKPLYFVLYTLCSTCYSPSATTENPYRIEERPEA